MSQSEGGEVGQCLYCYSLNRLYLAQRFDMVSLGKQSEIHSFPGIEKTSMADVMLDQ